MSESPHHEKRALIITIGLSSKADSPGIIDALAVDVEDFGPDHVVLISTAISRPIADRLAERIEPLVATVQHCSLEAAHDLNEVFGASRDAIEQLVGDGYARRDIAVNYGSGTKVMSCGLVMAAVFGRCGSLRYVRSGRGAPSERLIEASTAGVFAHRDLAMAVVSARELRFTSARRILRGVQTSLLRPEERTDRAQLLKLFEAYHAWHGFLIGRFLELYENVTFDSPMREPFRLSDEGLAAARQLAADLEAQRPSVSLCIELFNSAERCRFTGGLTDAFSRLYRAIEVLAQERLLERYGIDADDVDAHKAPPRYRPDFEALRSLQDGRIRLGLRKTYELLYRLEDDLGVDFIDDEQMPARLDERRSTILAHGVEPVSKTVADAFFLWTESFFSRHIEDFGQRREALQFPWLKEYTAARDQSVV